MVDPKPLIAHWRPVVEKLFAGVVARVVGLRGRMAESTRQVEGLFESLLNEIFGGDF